MQSNKPVMNGSRVESIDEAIKEYKKTVRGRMEKKLIDSKIFKK